MTNEQIAGHFEQLADLLDLSGENPFRVRAYRNAARVVESLARECAEFQPLEENLTELPGIGKDLAAKIAQMLETGRLEALDKARKALPPKLPELLTVQGLGPKKIRKLHEELGVDSIEALKAAAEQGRVRTLAGFGEKSEAAILEALAFHTGDRRYLLPDVRAELDALLGELGKLSGLQHLEPAGSYRRGRDTVGDLDLLALAADGAALMKCLREYSRVQTVLGSGDTKTSVQLRQGLQVDLRVVEPEAFGSAMLYFTGSQAHNVALRRRAKERDLKLNEYGLFRGDERVAGATEEDVYKALGLPWIPPELREDHGEIETAEKNALPKLIEQSDIRGDLHMHTTWSDGAESVREMAEAARTFGYSYIAITDHSQRLTVANGLDETRLRKQMEEIDLLGDSLDGITVLKGIEVDILEDGTLDMADEVLEQLDVVIGSVHSHFQLSRDRQTERLLKAMDHPCITGIGHPTGRLLLRRPGVDLDMERIIAHAAQRGCFLEVNANPQRLDLNEIFLRMAVDQQVLLCINTDAHRSRDFENLGYGVSQARRGWVTASSVLNTLPIAKLKRELQSIRRT